jgi:hypothetical protein
VKCFLSIAEYFNNDAALYWKSPAFGNSYTKLELCFVVNLI